MYILYVAGVTCGHGWEVNNLLGETGNLKFCYSKASRADLTD